MASSNCDDGTFKEKDDLYKDALVICFIKYKE